MSQDTPAFFEQPQLTCWTKGKQYAGPVGHGIGDDGTIGMGLFPFWESENGGISKLIHQVPIDFYGVHFEFVLPEFSGAQITSSGFHV